MKFPPLLVPQRENGGELVPQTFWHQIAARLFVLLAAYGLMETAKEISKAGTSLLAIGIGPSAKLPPVSTPAQRRRARIEAVTEPLEEIQLGLAHCGTRFQGQDGIYHSCSRLSDHVNPHRAYLGSGAFVTSGPPDPPADPFPEGSEDLPYSDELEGLPVVSDAVLKRAGLDDETLRQKDPGWIDRNQHAETEG